jgi:S-adenosylmethionine decarboxylase
MGKTEKFGLIEICIFTEDFKQRIKKMMSTKWELTKRKVFRAIVRNFMITPAYVSAMAGTAVLDWEETKIAKLRELTTFDKSKQKNDHDFVGRHLIVTYYDCDPKALRNHKDLSVAMRAAVKASGAQLLEAAEYLFPPDGMTSVMLLSESHASIHTYPEHNACFVDLFTCGNKCRAEKFDMVLRSYLKPAGVNSRILIRHREIEDDTPREI